MMHHSEERIPADFNFNFWGGLLFSIGFALVTGLAITFVPGIHTSYHELAESAAPVVVQQRGVSLLYAGWLVAGGLIIAGLYNGYIGIKGYRLRSTDQRFFKPLGYYLIVSIVLMIAGYHLGNKYWSEHFTNHSYSRCSNSFVMTGKWAQDVWVDSPVLCSSPEIRELLRSHQHDLADVNNYIASKRTALNQEASL